MKVSFITHYQVQNQDSSWLTSYVYKRYASWSNSWRISYTSYTLYRQHYKSSLKLHLKDDSAIEIQLNISWSIQVAAFWVVTLCSDVVGYLHGVTTQNTATWTFIAIKTSYLASLGRMWTSQKRAVCSSRSFWPKMLQFFLRSISFQSRSRELSIGCKVAEKA